MNGKTLYTLNGVTKRYGQRQVLQVDDLTITHGEVLALVGPSGAGKSTLLRLLNFLEPPTNGRIQFQGETFGAGEPMPIHLRRRVTTVFQRPFLLNRSVTANIQYGLRLRGRRGSARPVEEALTQVGLGGMSRQPARTLSGGEAQRVALARALVLNPEVLLLDEPTANLDPYNIGLIEEIVTGLNRDKGTTLVLVTHNIFQARRLASRVALLLDGRIVEINDADNFFNNPADPRTAAFVGGEMVY
ncbi:MAG: phosphate ABC transporter ATP-binding protein [Ardenticatenaceae bacterium]|nr:phosphate ABC transporter ATP-binding protein [Ardenticatenaceae bacterium]